MLPFSNRIADGKFDFNGVQHNLGPNRQGQPYPIHGHGWSDVWQVEDSRANSCLMSTNYNPKDRAWPWRYHAVQRIELLGSELIFTLSLQNKDNTPFPAGLGLHPFLASSETASVKFTAAGIWESGQDLIPTALNALSTPQDFETGKRVQSASLDNCFEGWAGSADVTWSDRDDIMTLSASPLFSRLVVYMDPQNDFFCLEPVSHVNNALNMDAPYGPQTLAPGEILSGQISFKMSAQDLL